MRPWNKVIEKCLGRKLLVKTMAISVDILCVSFGIKPSFLFDYGAVTVDQMKCLLQCAVSEGLLINNTLCVLDVNSDVVIINPLSIQTYLSHLKHSVAFIDVSGSLHSPQLLQTTEHFKVQPTIDCLQKIFDQSKEMTDFCGFTVEISPAINVTTLYGLLLGYPLIYWYENDGAGDFGQCLSMEPLQNICVEGDYCVDLTHLQTQSKGRNSERISTSHLQTQSKGCNSEGISTSHLQTQSKGSNSEGISTSHLQTQSKGSNSEGISTSQKPKKHVIYSFSFPDRFSSDLDSILQNWFYSIRSDESTWKNVFQKVELIKNVRTLSVISL